MSFFKRIKRFFIRKILRRIYDPEELLKIPFSEMNSSEIRFFMEVLYTGMIEAEGNLIKAVSYISEVPTHCDKCPDSIDLDYYCFKCEGTGIIKNKHLCDWPWEN